jgi:hypothetical protein
VDRARFAMNEPDGVADDIVEVSQVHGLAGFIEPKRERDGQGGLNCRDLLVRTLDVLEVMRKHIDKFEFARFIAPALSDNRGTLSTFLSSAINGMEDGDTSEIRMTNRAVIVMEVVEGGIDDDLKIPSERFHSSVLLLITDIANYPRAANNVQ